MEVDGATDSSVLATQLGVAVSTSTTGKDGNERILDAVMLKVEMGK
jgi:hypothetical protein